MATLEELVRMTDTRNPGMTRTPRGATMNGVTRGAELDNLTPGVAREDSGLRFSPGRSSVPPTPLAPALATGVGTMASATQGGRAAAEEVANSTLAQQLRRQNAREYSLASRFQEPGSLNPVEARFLLAQQAQNQNAMNATSSNVNAIREASLIERGQSLDALSGLTDRQMQEAGAFDRALLGLDQMDLQGQYGIDVAEAEGRARDPYAAFGLDIAEQISGAEGTDTNTLMGLANWARGLGAVAPGGSPYAFSMGPEGTSIEGPLGGQLPPDAVYLMAQQLPEGRARDAFYTQQGYAVGENGTLVPAQQAVEQQQARQQRRQEDNTAEMARRRERVQQLLDSNWTPSIGGM